MPRRRRPFSRALLVAIALLAILVAATLWFRPGRALRVATGTTAHDLCSETFVSRLDPRQTFTESLAPRPGYRLVAWGIRYDVDRVRHDVRAWFLGGFASRAIFRPGWGCVLANGDAPIAAPAAFSSVRAASAPDELAEPAVVEPREPRWKAALDAAFAEPDEAPHRWTKAVVVVHKGRIVAERYAPGYGVDTPILGFSMSKSVTNALVGILVRQGRLAVAAPAPIASWHVTDDPRAAITIEQLMRMTSGLDLDEDGSGFDPSNVMLYTEPDMAGYAERARLVVSPGKRWSYSSASTQVLARIVRDAVGGSGEAVQRFARDELFEPLGMRSMTMETDGTGTPVGAHYMLATARDWARLGCLYLDDGMAAGRRILPAGWAAFSATATLDTDYGAGWWTNRSEHPRALGRRRLGMPRDAFFASGNLGQRIAVVPSAHLVVVRMGRSLTPGYDVEGFAKLVAAAVEAVQPQGDTASAAKR
jgi:CubicO group peptidase (beta-lactamase class C family)